MAKSTGTPTTGDLAKTERATKSAEACATSLTPKKKAEIAKAAATKRRVPHG